MTTGASTRKIHTADRRLAGTVTLIHWRRPSTRGRLTPMSSPVTAGHFLERLARSGLLSAELLESFQTATDLDSGEQFADRLVRDGLLTAFHARLLLAGREGAFFLGEKYKVLDLIGTGGMG